MRAELQTLINNDQSEGFEGMSIHAEVMKLRQAVTLVETQSVEALRRYFERQRNQARTSGASKASQRMVSDPRVREAMRNAERFDEIHPKYSKARMLLAETLGLEGGERVIVFTESRDTAEALTDFLSESFDAKRFVGQGDREGSDGMTQKQQQEVLDEFRAGEFEVLVSTSVAEEGLDVPEVDLVLFYEPVPTAIRSIQRKGRTGRQTEGRVVVLMAEDTRDEAYFWISQRREKEMESELRELKGLAPEITEELDDSQQSLTDFEGAGEGGVKVDGNDGNTDAVGDSSSGSEGVVAGPGLQEFGANNSETGSNEEPGDGAAEIEEDVETHEPHAEGDTVAVVADQREMDANIARDLSRREEYEISSRRSTSATTSSPIGSSSSASPSRTSSTRWSAATAPSSNRSARWLATTRGRSSSSRARDSTNSGTSTRTRSGGRSRVSRSTSGRASCGPTTRTTRPNCSR